MDIAAVRTALAQSLVSLPGWNVSPYIVAQPTPPAIQILPPGCTYDLSMHRSLDEWTFTVQAFVALTTDIGSQLTLDTLTAPSGDTSVKTLLEADCALGGLVSDLRVIDQTPGRLAEHPSGNPYLLVEWTVNIWATP